MKVQRGYKTEIKPNNVQKTLLLKHAGAARWTSDDLHALFGGKIGE